MGLFDKLFRKQEARKQVEDFYKITLTDGFVKVEHPKRKTEQINWNDIDKIAIITTDEGPFLPDVWLILTGKDSGCSMPQGAPGYDEVFDIISNYEGFNFEEYLKSVSCTDNAGFEVWTRKSQNPIGGNTSGGEH